MIIGAANKSELPVGVQFDHTDDMTLILRAIRGGYNGIMVDASHRPMEENIAVTRSVVEMCHPLGILVEGEVGIITRTWDETPQEGGHAPTDPLVAAEYVERTGVDALAISIGEVSGFDSGHLEFDRLEAIRAKVAERTHLCLHGVSFIEDENIRTCIRKGISYFGCASEFRYAFFQKLDEVRKAEGPKMVDPTVLYGAARNAMKDSVKRKLELMGSAGRANSVLSSYFSAAQQ